MLRGVNIGGHHLIKMDALRALYESLGQRGVRTHVQSGNVVSRAEERDLAGLANRVESAIERTFGFRPAVVLRTAAELRDAIARNPFAARRDLDPSRLVVTFLAAEPGAEARDKVLGMRTDPEELRLDGREVFVYFPNGISKAKLSWPAVEKALRVTATGRNWNTVTRLLAMAEELEAATAGERTQRPSKTPPP